MTLAILFWILMLFWLLFGLYVEHVAGQPYPFNRHARHILIFVLLVIIGWRVFGGPIQ